MWDPLRVQENTSDEKYKMSTKPFKIQRDCDESIYAKSIYNAMKSNEIPQSSQLDVESVQDQINDNMRRVLVGWLTDVVEEYRMQTQTLFLTVDLLDKMLLLIPVKKAQFQLLGCACLFVASKFEEIEPMDANNLMLISDYCFTTTQLLDAEKTILRALQFNINVGTRYLFAIQIGSAVKPELKPREQSFVAFLLEISLYELSLNVIPASVLGAAAVHLTMQMMRHKDSPSWPPEALVLTGLVESVLVGPVGRLRELHAAFEGASQGTSTSSSSSLPRVVWKKYDSREHHRCTNVGAIASTDLRFDCQRPPSIIHVHKELHGCATAAAVSSVGQARGEDESALQEEGRKKRARFSGGKDGVEAEFDGEEEGEGGDHRVQIDIIPRVVSYSCWVDDLKSQSSDPSDPSDPSHPCAAAVDAQLAGVEQTESANGCDLTSSSTSLTTSPALVATAVVGKEDDAAMVRSKGGEGMVERAQAQIPAQAPAPARASATKPGAEGGAGNSAVSIRSKTAPTNKKKGPKKPSFSFETGSVAALPPSTRPPLPNRGPSPQLPLPLPLPLSAPQLPPHPHLHFAQSKTSIPPSSSPITSSSSSSSSSLSVVLSSSSSSVEGGSKIPLQIMDSDSTRENNTEEGEGVEMEAVETAKAVETVEARAMVDDDDAAWSRGVAQLLSRKSMSPPPNDALSPSPCPSPNLRRDVNTPCDPQPQDWMPSHSSVCAKEAAPTATAVELGAEGGAAGGSALVDAKANVNARADTSCGSGNGSGSGSRNTNGSSVVENHVWVPNYWGDPFAPKVTSPPGSSLPWSPPSSSSSSSSSSPSSSPTPSSFSHEGLYDVQWAGAGAWAGAWAERSEESECGSNAFGDDLQEVSSPHLHPHPSPLHHEKRRITRRKKSQPDDDLPNSSSSSSSSSSSPPAKECNPVAKRARASRGKERGKREHEQSPSLIPSGGSATSP